MVVHYHELEYQTKRLGQSSAKKKFKKIVTKLYDGNIIMSQSNIPFRS